jgi:HEAT repeat protein
MDATEYVNLTCSRNPWIRTEALERGEVVPRNVMLTAARACLTDPHEAVRDAAVQVLEQFGNNRDGYRLLAASHDRSWDVRSSVVTAFATLKIAHTTKRVREMLVSDPHFIVRREAAWILYAIDGEVATSVTSALENEKDEIVRVAIYAVLYLIGDNTALKSMLAYTKSSDFLVRDNVVNSLQQMTVRAEHVEFLKDFLTTFVEGEEHPGVKGDANITLRELSSQTSANISQSDIYVN